MTLCKYGIEYVEDPATHKRIPTVNRAQFTSVFDDENYKAALTNADIFQKTIYEEEAKTINDIQREILAISSKEEPFDVFICYKETDENGRRTPDSVLANDLYHLLTQEGFKVFFARITLEDKLGQEYEPYIFAALNSSKAMVVLGTKPEYFNAVWVKNEWSRYLALIKNGEQKILIPAYKDMDPYDLPEEFSHLQAQDMGKLGFMQDLIRGIKKIICVDDKRETAVLQQANANSNVSALLKRGNIALEDGEWQKADEFFEEVLNQDAECAEAYLGKLMVKFKQNSIQLLTKYYISKYEFCEKEKLKAEGLEACIEKKNILIEEAISKYAISDYLSEAEIRTQYRFDIDRTYLSELSFRKQQKEQQMSELSAEKLLTRAKRYAVGETKKSIDKMIADIEYVLDKRISDAQNADNQSIALVNSNYEKALNDADARIQKLYNDAKERQKKTYDWRVSQLKDAKTIFDYEELYNAFKEMNGYMDANQYADHCLCEINRIKEEERVEGERQEMVRRQKAEERARTKKRIAIRSALAIVVFALVSVVGIIVFNFVTKVYSYNKAVGLMNNGKYAEASKRFEDLYGYKDSNGLKVDCIKEQCNQADVGDIIIFGKNSKNDEWKVLTKKRNRVLVISKNTIETMPYNKSYKAVTWENCTLRSWLNDKYSGSVVKTKI